MTGDPPIGTEDVFPKADPDETPEERQVRIARQSSPGVAAPAGMNDTMDSGTAQADAIVRRESGVTDFSQAETEDRAGEYQIEDYPGQDDPSSAAGMRRNDFMDNSPGTTVARGINDFVEGAERLVDGDDNVDTGGNPRSRR